MSSEKVRALLPVPPAGEAAFVPLEVPRFTPAPPALPELLRPYQRRGVEWMHHLCDVGCHGLLADEMGLGKTMQAISAIREDPRRAKIEFMICRTPWSYLPTFEFRIRIASSTE